MKGKGKSAASATTTGASDRRVCVEVSAAKGEDDKWRELARVFRSWSGRVFGVALTGIYEHVDGHRDDPATILDLALTSLRTDCLATIPLSCITF